MKPVITHWRNLVDPEGEARETTWTALFRAFAQAEPYRGDNDQPGWSPARFDPCRRGLENVREVFALCLDYDHCEGVEAVRERWSDYFGLVHTTRKHTPEAPRCRVILPLSRPVSRFEFGELWKRVRPFAGDIDEAPKDPSRFWFRPGPIAGGEYVAVQLAGTPLDVDSWLARPDPTLSGRPVERPRVTDPTAVERRAISYIARMPEAISGQGGQRALWSAALVLARGFSLGEDRAYEILLAEYNPRCAPPWSEKELRHAAKNAAAARVPDGFKLEDDREHHWAPENAPAWQMEPPPGLFDDEVPKEETPSPAEESERQPGDDTEQVQAEQKSPRVRYGFVSQRDLMAAVAADLNKPRPKLGATTGSVELDAAIGGYRHGNLTVFGAKRGFGKTSYGNLVAKLAMPGLRLAMFAGEDSAMMYGKRFLAQAAGLNAMMLRDNRVNASDWPAIAQALVDAPTDLFFVRVEGRPVEWMAQAILDVGTHEGIDLVIVDYLQCIRANRKLQDRRNEVTYVAKLLSEATKRVGAAGLFFSQLKRGDREEPEIEDLKESGDIEDMADHVLLGWKSGSGDNIARKIKVAKNKDGTEALELAPVVMNWNRKTANFEQTGIVGTAFDARYGSQEDPRYPDN